MVYFQARLKPMIECGKGSSRDSVDGNTRSKVSVQNYSDNQKTLE